MQYIEKNYSSTEKQGIEHILQIFDVSCETLKNAKISRENVSHETLQKFVIYSRMLSYWQKSINLVSPSTLPNMWQRHFCDSAQFFTLMANNTNNNSIKTWLDLGSGAGFPSLVIAILLANFKAGKIHLIEANGKKCSFLRQVIEKTQIADYAIVHNGRIEAILPKLSKLQKFDIITARGLASLDNLLHLTHKVLHKNNFALFAKGKNISQEIEKAQKIWNFNFQLIPSLTNSSGTLLKIKNICIK